MRHVLIKGRIQVMSNDLHSVRHQFFIEELQGRADQCQMALRQQIVLLFMGFEVELRRSRVPITSVVKNM